MFLNERAEALQPYTGNLGAVAQPMNPALMAPTPQRGDAWGDFATVAQVASIVANLLRL